MISHFPKPYPDELFESVCGRFAQRIPMVHRSTAHVMLFGNAFINDLVHLPSYLGTFVSNIPATLSMTVGDWIERHTIYPYYAPFLSIEQAKALYNAMEATGSLKSDTRVRRPSGRPDRLRCCPKCIEADRESYGEAYWHRLHQIRAVRICPVHHTYLQEFGQNLGLRERFDYAPLETLLDSVPSTLYINLENDHDAVLLAVAEQAAYLLNHPARTFAAGVLSLTYRRNLVVAKMARVSGHPKIQEFDMAFRKAYSESLLNTLEVLGQPPLRSSWKTVLTGIFECHHPLQHILLARFFGLTVKQLFESTVQPVIFEPGPWPCLNPVCKKFKKPVIKDFEERLLKRRTYVLVGVFKCSCGYTYTRRAPDPDGATRFVQRTVEARGPVWNARLIQLWNEPSTSVTEMARVLGASDETVKKHGFSLGNLESRTSMHSNKELKRRSASSFEQMLALRAERRQEKLMLNRKAFSHYLMNNPDTNRLKMRDDFNEHADLKRVWNFLVRHDKEWLDEQIPLLKRHPKRFQNAVVDDDAWRLRNEDLAQQIRKSREILAQEQGPPIRISSTRLLKFAGYPTNQLTGRWAMGLAAAALSECQESFIDVAIRRVIYLKSELWKNSGRLRVMARGRLIKEAGVRPEWLSDPRIIKALEDESPGI